MRSCGIHLSLRGQFHRKSLRYEFENLWFKITDAAHRGQWVNQNVEGCFTSSGTTAWFQQHFITLASFYSFLTSIPSLVNSLAPEGFDCSLKLVNFKLISTIINMGKYFLGNCYQVNATNPHWSLVNIGSGNGLVPSGNKPIPEPMLT